jgi:hypothetical protein
MASEPQVTSVQLMARSQLPGLHHWLQECAQDSWTEKAEEQQHSDAQHNAVQHCEAAAQ